MTADISTPTNRYEELSAKRALPRALMGGTKEMRAQGKTYLPQHPAETLDSYNLRLDSTTLYNGFKDTIKKMTGKIFSKDILPDENIPTAIADLLSNIDGAGRNLTAFAYDAFFSAMTDGISFIYSEFPVVKREDGALPTMADQLAQGARPYTVLVKASQLIGCKSENIGGTQMLTEIRIREILTEPDGEWGEKEVIQIRLIQIGYWFTFRYDKDTDEWIIHDLGEISLPYIPLIPVYTNRVGFYEGEPPLDSLAELNLEHWISSSEQRRALAFARFAMLTLTGVQGTTNVDVGPDVVIKLADPSAKASYTEPSGTGIEAGRLDLEAIEKRMQHTGMTIRVQTPGGVTATAAAIDSTDSDAALLAAAGGLQDSLNSVLQTFADYLGEKDGGEVLVNKSFGVVAPNGTAGEVLSLHMAVGLRKKTLIEEYKRRGVLADTVDVEEEVAAETEVDKVDGE